MYKLKAGQPDFTVVDGALANHTFKAGEIYAEIPPQEKHRFEEAKTFTTEGTDPKTGPSDGNAEKISGKDKAKK